MKVASGKKKFTLCMAACMILGLGFTGCSGGKSDTTAPVGSSSLSTTSATKGSVVITVTATDSGSGVASITLPNGTVVSAASTTYTVTANGTYNFIVTDKAGNTTPLPVTVSNIDTTAPTAASTLSPATTTSGNVTITVNASDAGSGVASITKPDGSVVTTASTTYTATADGVYNFTITDMAGNTSIFPVTVSNIARTTTADAAIQNVFVTGFVDADGAKAQAIAIKYNIDLTGADINASDFEVWDYALGQAVGIGSNPGVVTGVYIDNEPFDTDGKTGSGNYIVFTLNTNYQLSSVPAYRAAMAAGVKQLGAFTTAGGVTVSASDTEFKNYTLVSTQNHSHVYVNVNTAIESQFTLTNITGFKRYSSDSSATLGYTSDGDGFAATNCFDEVDGLLHSVDLGYDLFVPADYDASKKYMLVLHVGDAGSLGTDPMIELTESQGPANYASAAVQQLAKDQGFGGLIVVTPQIPTALRSTRDNYSLSAAVPATWQLMDYITNTYNIDTDHIYASGQSMGGMQVIAMAAQRDNYFAAVWPIASQWGSNNDLEVPFVNGGSASAPFYQSNDATIWTVDADGNSIDSTVQRNWYYMISDDNILIDNCTGDGFSTPIWQEATTLYKDYSNNIIDVQGTRYTLFNPLTLSLDDQNAAVRALTSSADFQNPDFGIRWEAYIGGNHGLTWVWAHHIFANYQWLLSQNRQTEMARGKLAMSGAYAKAATQLTDTAHTASTGTVTYTLPTAAVGSGTAGYNTTFLDMNGNLIRPAGWLASDYGY